MEHVVWTPALVALVAGLACGAALAWMLRGARTISAADDAAGARRRDLEVHRDTLLDQLRELDDISAGRDPALLARERERLELLAARVLAQLDEAMPAAPKGRAKAGAAEAAKAAPAPSAVDARRAARRGFAWGIGSAVAVGGLIVWVAGVVKPRGESGQLTGDLPARQGAMNAPPAAEDTAPDPELAQLEQAVAQKPEDVDLRLELTQAYLGRRDLMKVWEETQEVLKRSPGHPRAMSYQALVRLAMGQADAAEQQLKDAMKAAPDLLEPRLHLSLVYARTGRVDEANKVLDEAERRFPTQKQGLERLRNEMMAQVAEGAGEGAEHPPVASAAQAGPHVAGQIELDPARGAAPPGAILFLIARAAGQTEGPPVAVKRLPPQFPQRFTLSSEDSMMGQELPAELRVEARLDSDGNPLTRPPSDPSARLDGVKLGDDSLRLRLR
jgi:tetratricopeptide (TPR) repeat protein